MTRMKIIIELLEEIHERKFNKALDYDSSYLEQHEKSLKLKGVFDSMGLDGRMMMDFLKGESH